MPSNGACVFVVASIEPGHKNMREEMFNLQSAPSSGKQTFALHTTPIMGVVQLRSHNVNIAHSLFHVSMAAKVHWLGVVLFLKVSLQYNL